MATIHRRRGRAEFCPRGTRAVVGLATILCLGAATSLLAQSTRQQREACLAGRLPPTETIDACSKLIEYGLLDPDLLAGAHTARGNAYDDLDQMEPALADYAAALVVQPDSAFALRNRGVALHRHKRDREALPDLDRAIEIDSRYGAAYEVRAGALLELAARADPAQQQSMLQRALADATRALELQSREHHVRLLFGLMSVHRALGDIDAAIDDITWAIAIDPSITTDALVDRGNLRRRRGSLVEAAADYSQALSRDGAHVNARWGRAVTRFELADFTGALNDLSDMLVAQPQATRLRGMRGIVYLRTGDYRLAVQDLERPFIEMPDDPALLYCAGVAYTLAGDAATAAPLLERAVSRRPDVSVTTGLECTPHTTGQRLAVGDKVCLPPTREPDAGAIRWTADRDAYLRQIGLVTSVGDDGAVKVDADGERLWWPSDWLLPYPAK